jgi:hypothetical protein
VGCGDVAEFGFEERVSEPIDQLNDVQSPLLNPRNHASAPVMEVIGVADFYAIAWLEFSH